ncbi:uncharacterized protein LY79DRAFT_132197 [Colletotrichum navitas]|uniref:Uncharacterized protein n=1 Tax=Colletotrichum navitas TaxID=681940 RepID=A0AAD8Q3I0_9PEZI|nr:uncharacterized protein LY79DRAFT_132197 [Colletotrichum navitas]KAK1594551.1 hypothetical protein LY79DRAFT_132197 [Colletotrichum navitas]
MGHTREKRGLTFWFSSYFYLYFSISCLRDVIQSSHSYLNPSPPVIGNQGGGGERTEPKPMVRALNCHYDPPFPFFPFFILSLFCPPPVQYGEIAIAGGTRQQGMRYRSPGQPLAWKFSWNDDGKKKRKEKSPPPPPSRIPCPSVSICQFPDFPSAVPFPSLFQPVSARAVWPIWLGRNPETVTMLLRLLLGPLRM